MKAYGKLEQNLSGIWVELFCTESTMENFNAPDNIETMNEGIKQFSKSTNISLVYADENGNTVAISFDGTAGPLRMTYFKK